MTALQLYNTLTSQLENFEPLEAGKVRLYVCGPTVYDDAHLGHARCYITWDVLVRALRWLGYEVTYVRNVTDVDDKILNRAAERGVSPAEVAATNYASFTADMDALNTLRPDQEPKATAYIDEMRTAIQALMDKGFAYATSDGSVYYRTRRFDEAHYMQLSKRSFDDLQSGARVDVDPGKEDPLDFALWKAAPAEDANAWPSPWGGSGQGRPGWHIECSAMNHAVFGPQIDIHAGGADLIFPHHTNEIAQSEAWTGCAPFAKYWLHNGFVNVSGEKMSKSLGNFATIKTLLKRYDANTVRCFLLTNKYRMPVDFTEEALNAAESRIQRFHEHLRVVAEKFSLSKKDFESMGVEYQSYLAESKEKQGEANYFLYSPGAFFDKAVEDLEYDLNTPQALSRLDMLISQVYKETSQWDSMRENLPYYDPAKMEPAEAERFARYNYTVKEHFIKTLSCTLQLFKVLGFSVDLIFSKKHVDLPVDAIRTIYKELTGEWLEADQEAAVLLEKIIALRTEAKATRNWTQADAIRKHLSDIGIQLMDSKDGTTWELTAAHVPA
ncbi:MAG: cysteine--tRNA ligase [Candidatus Melainabacteria bacterium]